MKLGVWFVGRVDVLNEIVEWVGGLVDFFSGLVMVVVRRIIIMDFVGGDEVLKKRMKEYEYINWNGMY